MATPSQQRRVTPASPLSDRRRLTRPRLRTRPLSGGGLRPRRPFRTDPRRTFNMLVKRTIEKRRARDLKATPQVRKTFPAEEVLRQLAKSVMTRQLHPLVILPSDVILDGECRWRGVMLVQPDHEFDVIV